MRTFALALLVATAFAGDRPPIGSNPGPIKSTGIAVTNKTTLKIGQTLQVLWSSTWWAAEITALGKDGRVKITYIGWAASWDVWVPRTSLQLDDKAVQKAKAVIAAVRAPRPPAPKPQAVAPRPWNPGPIKSSGLRLDVEHTLHVGLLLQVKWGNRWWAGKVVEISPKGLFKIVYIGWGATSAEWVARERLQFDTNPPRISEKRPAK
jgi:hypothetical protein